MATTLHDEIMSIPCEPIEGTESEVLAFHEMVDQHRQNTADAYGEAMDDHAVKVMTELYKPSTRRFREPTRAAKPLR